MSKTLKCLVFLVFAGCTTEKSDEPEWDGNQMMAEWIAALELQNSKLTCKQDGDQIWCTLAYDDKMGRRVLQDVVCVRNYRCHLNR